MDDKFEELDKDILDLLFDSLKINFTIFVIS